MTFKKVLQRNAAGITIVAVILGVLALCLMGIGPLEGACCQWVDESCIGPGSTVEVEVPVEVCPACEDSTYPDCFGTCPGSTEEYPNYCIGYSDWDPVEGPINKRCVCVKDIGPM